MPFVKRCPVLAVVVFLSATVPPVFAWWPADFDGDSDVDLTDFAGFTACFNGPNRAPVYTSCGYADFDLDGDVDLADFGVFAACFNGPNRAPACAPVLPPPEGMVLIGAGEFEMGDSFNEGYTGEDPVHAVWVDAFYMDRYEVTKGLWDAVRTWATSNGYSDLVARSGKAPDHPVCNVTWYECVKWCNARSQQEGRTPCYYSDAELTTVHMTGQLAPHVKWDANGYRLPTEAEWEKAARGGASGRRFPWSDQDTIEHARANFYSSWSGGVPYYPYDTSATSGYHPTFAVGDEPYTSPVGYFAPNDYGLYDMAGNIREWCNDRYDNSYYSSSPYYNPRGPETVQTYRILRGGSWNSYAFFCRVAYRQCSGADAPMHVQGFRCVVATE